MYFLQGCAICSYGSVILSLSFYYILLVPSTPSYDVLSTKKNKMSVRDYNIFGRAIYKDSYLKSKCIKKPLNIWCWCKFGISSLNSNNPPNPFIVNS